MLHLQGLGLGRADLHAGGAALAVQGADLHAEAEAGQVFAVGFLGHERGGSLFQLVVADQHGPDGGVGADQRALVALDAVFQLPLRHEGGDAALFEFGTAAGEGAVLPAHESGDGQLVAPVGAHGTQDVLDEGGLVRECGGLILGVGPVGGHRHFPELGQTGLHRVLVHGHDFFALLAVGVFDGVVQGLDRGLLRDDAGELEEGGLHHHIGAVAQAQASRDVHGVDHVELGLFLGQSALHVGRQLFGQLFRIPGGIEQEGAPLLQAFQQVVGADVCLVGAGDEIGLVDQVRRVYFLHAEAQVGHGQAAGLLGVVVEVGLGIHVGIGADDIHRLLVGAHRAVGAQTPELALDGALRQQVFRFHPRQGGAGHVVHDGDGEAVLGFGRGQIVVHGHDIAGHGVFGAQTVAAADDQRLFGLAVESGHHVLAQRFVDGTGGLDPVQNGDALHRFGQAVQEIVFGKGAVEADLDQADLAALGVQLIHHGLDSVADRAHGHDDVGSVGCAVVIEQLVIAAGDLADLGQVAGHDFRDLFVEGVGGFPGLEEDVRVLVGAADHGMVGVQSRFPEAGQSLPVQQAVVFGVIHHFDLLLLVAGAEAVEEVDEGHPAFDGGQVGHAAQVHDLLHGAGAQHGETGLVAGHDVGMVAENVQAVGGQGTGGNVQHARQQLAGHFIHIGDHQQQTLGGGEGGGQGAGRKGAVHSAGSAGLRLHLHQPHRVAEDVLLAAGSPFVAVLRHGRAGRDGVDGCRFGESVGCPGRRFVAVHRFHLLAHNVISILPENS